jgi:hypothetical protein
MLTATIALTPGGRLARALLINKVIDIIAADRSYQGTL